MQDETCSSSWESPAWSTWFTELQNVSIKMKIMSILSANKKITWKKKHMPFRSTGRPFYLIGWEYSIVQWFRRSQREVRRNYHLSKASGQVTIGSTRSRCLQREVAHCRRTTYSIRILTNIFLLLQKSNELLKLSSFSS